MTNSDVDWILYRLSYKKGWDISAVYGEDDHTHDATIAIRVSVPIASLDWKPSPRHDETKVLLFTYPAVSLRTLTGSYSVIELVRRALVMVEMHELYEWFAIDGEPILYPHLASGEASF